MTQKIIAVSFLMSVKKTQMEMDIVEPDHQFVLFLDDVRLPAEALVGEADAALMQLFAGLNPERILGAAMAIGMGRYAIDAAVKYAKERTVWSRERRTMWWAVICLG